MFLLNFFFEFRMKCPYVLVDDSYNMLNWPVGYIVMYLSPGKKKCWCQTSYKIFFYE